VDEALESVRGIRSYVEKVSENRSKWSELRKLG
jgi:hypothetical protein